MSEKSAIRKALIKKRNSIDPVLKKIYDREITRLIISSPYFQNAGQILAFSSTGSEFDTRGIIEKSRETGKNVFLPKCTDKDGHMIFLKSDGNFLQKGLYGIFEPENGCEEYIEKKNDIAIIPALSVDKRFIRIGYGKGYYDRFLKNFHGIGICPCYKEMLSQELPADEFDIKIDIVVTQTGFLIRHEEIKSHIVL